jgi:hypothetical protein
MRPDLNDPVAQLLYLARFFCFLAVFYLALHKIVAHLSRKPSSKLLWFFSVLTAPLMRPVRAFTMPGASDERLLSRALLFYGFLWLCMVAAGRVVVLIG